MHPHSTSAPLPDTTLAYLAGFLDGEGCIQIRLGRSRCVGRPGFRNTYQLRVTATQSDRAILELLSGCFGGPVRVQRAATERHRTCYEWSIGGPRASDMLAALLPYLRGKQAQAALAIAFREHVGKMRRGAWITDEEYARRAEYRRRMQELNGGGPRKSIRQALPWPG